jgi:hypothetical protein
VLGVYFDTRDLSWKLPVKKFDTTLQALATTIKLNRIQLKPVQSLTGRLNDAAQMCPFPISVKHPLNMILADCLVKGPAVWLDQAIRDPKIWSGFLCNLKNSMPIPHPIEELPLCTKTFHSDAAEFPKNGTLNDDTMVS